MYRFFVAEKPNSYGFKKNLRKERERRRDKKVENGEREKKTENREEIENRK